MTGERNIHFACRHVGIMPTKTSILQFNVLGTQYTEKDDIIMVMGDLNAKVGQDNYMLKHVMGIHGIGARNVNGERFVDFCSANHVIGGTIFQHKICHKVT